MQTPSAVTPELCRDIINIFEENYSIESTFSEGVSLDHTQQPWLGKLESVRQVLDLNVEKYIQPIKGIISHQYDFKSYSMLKYQPGESIPFHYDEEIDSFGKSKHFIGLLYLNNIELGGELLFPLQKEVIKPRAGLLVLFPTFITHPHQVLPTFEQVRYCMRIHYKVINRTTVVDGHHY